MPSPGDSKKPSQGQGPAHVPHIGESTVQLLPISLYPRAAAGSRSRLFLLLDLPLAGIATSNEGDIALSVAAAQHPWIMLFQMTSLAPRLNPVSLKHGSPSC